MIEIACWHNDGEEVNVVEGRTRIVQRIKRVWKHEGKIIGQRTTQQLTKPFLRVTYPLWTVGSLVSTALPDSTSFLSTNFSFSWYISLYTSLIVLSLTPATTAISFADFG